MPSHGAPELPPTDAVEPLAKPLAESSAEPSAQPSALVTPAVARLKRRADFLRASKGRRWHGVALTLQSHLRDTAEARDTRDPAVATPRVGFTLTKKVGCAVIRNRARRRLREAIRLCPDLALRADHDYVVVGRLPAIRLPFDALRDEVARAVRAVHAAPSSGKASRRPDRDIARVTGSGGDTAGRTKTRRTP